MNNTTFMLITKCTNTSCSHSLSIPMMIGSIFPTLSSYCPKCDSILVIDSIIKNKANTNRIIDEIPLSDSKLTKPPAEIITLKNLELNGLASGGPNIFTGFVNRLTPLYILIQLIGTLQSNGIVELEVVINNWKKQSQVTREALQIVEVIHDARRGERLSDGFPTSDSEKTAPMQIFLRNALGTDGRYISPDRGWLQKLGLVERIDSTTLRITEKANPILGLADLKRIITNEEPRIEGNHPQLLVFIPEMIAENMLNIISDLMPDEYAWAIHILQEIDIAQNESKLGWDSNHYASVIVTYSANGQELPRWIYHDGVTSLYEMYLEKGYKFSLDKKRKAKKRVHNPELFAQERLLSHVNSTLGGLLSRLKELGLIHPVRVGRAKNFLLTEFGKRIITNHITDRSELI